MRTFREFQREHSENPNVKVPRIPTDEGATRLLERNGASIASLRTEVHLPIRDTSGFKTSAPRWAQTRGVLRRTCVAHLRRALASRTCAAPRCTQALRVRAAPRRETLASEGRLCPTTCCNSNPRSQSGSKQDPPFALCPARPRAFPARCLAKSN